MVTSLIVMRVELKKDITYINKIKNNLTFSVSLVTVYH